MIEVFEMLLYYSVSRRAQEAALETLTFLVDLFQDVRPDDCVQVRLHVVKGEVNVAVILSANDML